VQGRLPEMVQIFQINGVLFLLLIAFESKEEQKSIAACGFTAVLAPLR